jgi:hypothetical protein
MNAHREDDDASAAEPFKGHAYYHLAAALDWLRGPDSIQGQEFDPREIKGIESYWTESRNEAVCVGYVCSLQRGQRFYLECFLGEDDPADKARVKIVMLPDDQEYPALDAEPVNWSTDTASLNRLLIAA